MNKININGKEIVINNGANVNVVNNQIYVDNKLISDVHNVPDVMNVTIEGDCSDISHITGDINIKGNCEDISNVVGDVQIGNEIKGNITNIVGSIIK